jgi:hypothetical protein
LDVLDTVDMGYLLAGNDSGLSCGLLSGA